MIVWDTGEEAPTSLCFLPFVFVVYLNLILKARCHGPIINQTLMSISTYHLLIGDVLQLLCLFVSISFALAPSDMSTINAKPCPH